MAQVIDIIPELPSPRELTAADVLTLAEELVAYQQHFAPFFRRREQREWAAVYLRGLLTADVPRKNIEAMALRLLGVGPHSQRQVRALQQFIVLWRLGRRRAAGRTPPLGPRAPL